MFHTLRRQAKEPSMVITDVKTTTLTGYKDWNYVRVETDHGLSGIGEAHPGEGINDAIVTQQSRQQERLEEEGYMNRSQVEDMLATKEAEYARRDQAKEQLLATLNAEGIDLGSEEHTQVQTYYRKAIEDGLVTPNILLSEAGVRTLVAMSGVKGGGEGAGPQSGLPQTSPDGSIQYGSGTVQLNAEGQEGSTLADRVRIDMEKQLRNLS